MRRQTTSRTFHLATVLKSNGAAHDDGALRRQSFQPGLHVSQGKSQSDRNVAVQLLALDFQKIENAFRHRASRHQVLRSDPLGIISCSGRSRAGTNDQISDMPDRFSTSRFLAVNLAGSVNVAEQPQH